MCIRPYSLLNPRKVINRLTQVIQKNIRAHIGNLGEVDSGTLHQVVKKALLASTTVNDKILKNLRQFFKQGLVFMLLTKYESNETSEKRELHKITRTTVDSDSVQMITEYFLKSDYLTSFIQRQYESFSKSKTICRCVNKCTQTATVSPQPKEESTSPRADSDDLLVKLFNMFTSKAHSSDNVKITKQKMFARVSTFLEQYTRDHIDSAIFRIKKALDWVRSRSPYSMKRLSLVKAPQKLQKKLYISIKNVDFLWYILRTLQRYYAQKYEPDSA